MTINSAIIRTLDELKCLTTSLDVYKNIVSNNYYDFGDSKTPEMTVAARLGDFIRNQDDRVKRVRGDSSQFLYYSGKYEGILFPEKKLHKPTITQAKSSNMTLTKPAVKVAQGNLTIYATSLKVKDLLIPQFYQVDKLDASNESSGFQRVLDKTRTKRLADYILKAWKDKDAFLPTSIFLATDKNVHFDPSRNEITFEIDKVCPFNVVDGQHRVEGLIEAARQNSEIEDFELIANIAVNLDDVTQMCHFLIVNTTQKSVNKAVEQQIISRLSGMVDVEEIPTLPKWIQNQVVKGEDKEALVITNYLNSEQDSPWFQKIRMANQAKDGENTITQESFVQSLKTYILTANNPLAGDTNIDKRNKILKNYWKAVDSLLVNKDSNKDTVIYKTNGLELFNMVSVTVFTKLYSEQNFTVDRIIEVFKHGFSNLNNDYLDIQDPEWWESGNGTGASNYNKGAIRHIAVDLSRAINVQVSSDNFKL